MAKPAAATPKRASSQRPSAPKVKAPKKATVKTKSIPPKLTFEKTAAELEADVNAYIKAHFAPTVKEKPEKQIGRAEFRHWVQNFQNKQQAKGKKPLPQTDYDRTLQKEIDKKKRAKKSGKGVPQLGEQALQTVAPLVIPYEYGSKPKVDGIAY